MVHPHDHKSKCLGQPQTPNPKKIQLSNHRNPKLNKPSIYHQTPKQELFFRVKYFRKKVRVFFKGLLGFLGFLRFFFKATVLAT